MSQPADGAALNACVHTDQPFGRDRYRAPSRVESRRSAAIPCVSPVGGGRSPLSPRSSFLEGFSERPQPKYTYQTPGISPTAGEGGGFNRSMQHTMIRPGGRSVADELSDTDVLHREPEGIDVGAVEGGLDSSRDRSPVRSTAHVYPRHSVENGWHPTAKAMPLPSGADFERERGDLARASDRRIYLLNRCTARSSAIDSQPRTEAQWRPRELSSHAGRQRRLGSGTAT